MFWRHRVCTTLFTTQYPTKNIFDTCRRAFPLASPARMLDNHRKQYSHPIAEAMAQINIGNSETIEKTIETNASHVLARPTTCFSCSHIARPAIYPGPYWFSALSFPAGPEEGRGGPFGGRSCSWHSSFQGSVDVLLRILTTTEIKYNVLKRCLPLSEIIQQKSVTLFFNFC